MRKGPAVVVILLAAALVGLLSYGVAQRGEDRSIDAALVRGERIPAPEYESALGVLGGPGQQSLVDYKGKVVVLNFWASWCDPCVEELPLLERTHEALERRNATVVGVNLRDVSSDALGYVRRFRLTFPSLRDPDAEYARAYDNIRPSVVRVVSYVKKSRLQDKAAKLSRGTAKPKPLGPALGAQNDADEEEVEHGVGTGVVIVDKGVILTNLHVVSGSDRIKVIFHDGLESTATINGVQPENDLAVLQAQKIPDDMIAATMRSTSDLGPGDKVLAVGFPFGIGPSASAGIVSGLKRSFRSPEGKQEMNNLIQFDAAANPGNSGGPLVTMDGEVVGIVTAILNPTPARTFLGIGFAVPIENAASAAGLPPF